MGQSQQGGVGTLGIEFDAHNVQASVGVINDLSSSISIKAELPGVQESS